MLKKLLPIVFTLISLTILCSDNENSEKKNSTNTPNLKKQAEIVRGTEKFGIELLKTINRLKPEDNIVISPLSASMALGMTLNGASGATRDEISRVLNFNDIKQEQINDTYHHLLTRLPEMDPKVTISMANSIWYRDNLTLYKDFINKTKESFLSEIISADFSSPTTLNMINTWIENNTNGLIKNMLDSIPGDALLYLFNTVYFKGTWTYEFDKKLTREGTFARDEGDYVNCSYMLQSNQFDQLEREEVKAVKLPYGDGKYSMVFMLPEKNIDTFINDLTQDRWNDYLNGFCQDTGYIEIPKFKVKYKNLLNEALMEMGMPTAFSGGADFSNICQFNLFISRVIHQTVIEVDEKGTEAAGATIIEIKYTSTEPEIFTLNLNRPFIFAIIENESNTLLFTGKISNPLFD